MKRSEPLRQKTPMKRVNRKRRAKLKAQQFGDHADYIRSLPCLVPECELGPIHAAHVRSRGAGGTASDLVPLCGFHHSQQHTVGIETFQRMYRIDMALVAVALWLRRPES